MSRRTTGLLKAGLTGLHYSGLARLGARVTRPAGVIFMLHHVLPDAPRDAFDPNGILRVTPAFLRLVIQRTRGLGFDIVSLDEAHRRLLDPAAEARPFACFTLDDGYRDNREHAYPVFKSEGVPFIVFVAADYADQRGEVWWLALEDVLRRNDRIVFNLGERADAFALATAAEKRAAFHRIYWSLRRRPEAEARALVRDAAVRIGIGPYDHCRRLVMTWDELRALASDPLVAIGAHTLSHFATAGLLADDVRREITGSVERIEREIGRPCRHFAFPYGDGCAVSQRDIEIAAELGLATAVTTEKGLLGRHAGSCLTGLPRLSLNGEYQSQHYIDVLLSGVPFALYGHAKRIRSAVGGGVRSARTLMKRRAVNASADAASTR